MTERVNKALRDARQEYCTTQCSRLSLICMTYVLAALAVEHFSVDSSLMAMPPVVGMVATWLLHFASNLEGKWAFLRPAYVSICTVVNGAWRALPPETPWSSSNGKQDEAFREAWIIGLFIHSHLVKDWRWACPTVLLCCGLRIWIKLKFGSLEQPDVPSAFFMCGCIVAIVWLEDRKFRSPIETRILDRCRG